MATKRKQIDPEIKKQLLAMKKRMKQESIIVSDYYLFGSRAKGNAFPESDIDVAVVVPTLTKKNYDTLMRKVYILAHGVDPRFETHLVAKKDIANKYMTIPSAVREHGIAF
ncbi:MAG: nucleotidyltransferase domain-containing protein [bacterium]|nr:nucleotidyltransferase domain-containing protein [bacterium]